MQAMRGGRQSRPRSLSSETRRSDYISFSPFKQTCPSLPMMMWSSMAMPSGVAASTTCFVISMSARDGVGSPEGRLWTLAILRQKARFCAIALSHYDRHQSDQAGAIE